MAQGHEFYEMIGGTAATLLGLLFVSMSLNAEIILGPDKRHLKRLAEQAFHNYLGVIVTSLLVVFPGISPPSFGYTLMSIAAFSTAWVLVRAYQAFQSPLSLKQRYVAARRYLWTVAGFLFLLYAGHETTIGDAPMVMGWLGAATIMLLVSATFVSWDLLVEVADEKYAEHRAAED